MIVVQYKYGGKLITINNNRFRPNKLDYVWKRLVKTDQKRLSIIGYNRYGPNIFH